MVEVETISDPWFWWDVFVDFYFIFDIFINFRTTFRSRDGEIMLEPKQIAKNYLRGWFTVDLVSCFPITYIELIASDGGKSEAGRQMKVLKITRLLRLAKMLRLARLKRVLKRIDEQFPGIWTVSKLSGLMMIILYISHIFACLW